MVGGADLSHGSYVFRVTRSTSRASFTISIGFFQLFLRLCSIRSKRFRVYSGGIEVLFRGSLRTVFNVVYFRGVAIYSSLSRNILGFQVEGVGGLKDEL